MPYAMAQRALTSPGKWPIWTPRDRCTRVKDGRLARFLLGESCDDPAMLSCRQSINIVGVDRPVDAVRPRLCSWYAMLRSTETAAGACERARACGAQVRGAETAQKFAGSVEADGRLF